MRLAAPAGSRVEPKERAPLRILMIAARYFPFVGGIETHIHEAGRRLVVRGHSVTVLTTDVTWDLPPTEDVDGMTVVRVRAWPRRRDYYWAPGILAYVAKGHWDVIHIQGYHTFSAPLGMIAALKARAPFAITFHSGGHSSGLRNWLRAPQHALLGPLVRRAARPIAVSEFEADFFSQRMRIPRDEFRVVPNGAHRMSGGSSSPLDKTRPLIVSIGRLEKYKGHHRVIEAFACLLRTIPGARLRVVGNGPYEPALRKLVGDLGLGKSVEIKGTPASDRSALADILSRAALVTLMSEYEAHPISVVESLSVNRPVLTSDTSGFRELAEKGLVRSISLQASPSELAAVMAQEVQSPRIVAPFKIPDWDACADRLQDIYFAIARPRAELSDAAASLPTIAALASDAA